MNKQKHMSKFYLGQAVLFPDMNTNEPRKGWILESRPSYTNPTDPKKILYTVTTAKDQSCWYAEDLIPLDDNTGPENHQDKALLEKMLFQRVQDLFFAAKNAQKWLKNSEQCSTTKDQRFENVMTELDVALAKFSGSSIERFFEIMYGPEGKNE